MAESDKIICKNIGEYDSQISKRELKKTEKGREYQLTILRGKFRTCYTKWQKQANALSILLSDTESSATLRDERKKFDNYFDDLSEVFDEIYQLDSGCNLVEKFDATADEHKTLMQQISELIRSLESDMLSMRSASSKQSIRSRSSHDSRVSVAAEAATIKAELKYVEAEAKTRAELAKLDLMKRLDIASAKLNVITHDDRSSELSEPLMLPLDSDKKVLMDKFIQSQDTFQTEKSDTVEPTGLET